MQKIILFLLILSPFAMSAQRTIAFEGLVENNELYYYQDKLFTGRSIRKHDNGKKAQEANWKNGKLHGTKSEWWKAGTMREKMNFIAGVRHGEFSLYYDNGSIKMKGNYEKDLLEGALEGYYRNGNKEYVVHYENGIKNGMSTTYFDFNGEQTYADVDNIEQQVLFVDGKPHGELNSYYRAGNPRNTLHYNMGVLHGASTSWHINALLAEEAYFKNGKKDSIKRVYDNLLGNLISQEFYKEGKKDGIWISFGQLGDTVTVSTYKEDTLHGAYYTMKDGEKNSFGNYVNGKKHGVWKTGQVDNYRRTEGEYNMGMEIGEWFYYDIEGKKLLRRVFDSEGYITEEEIL